jgi:hypothetical protein
MPGLTRQVRLVPVRHVRSGVTKPDKTSLKISQLGRLQMDRFGLDQLGRSGRSGFVLQDRSSLDQPSKAGRSGLY